MRFYDFDIFSGKKPAGTSFHVLVMQAHARTGAHTVPDVEEMLHKVRWGLREGPVFLGLRAVTSESQHSLQIRPPIPSESVCFPLSESVGFMI